MLFLSFFNFYFVIFIFIIFFWQGESSGFSRTLLPKEDDYWYLTDEIMKVRTH